MDDTMISPNGSRIDTTLTISYSVAVYCDRCKRVMKIKDYVSDTSNIDDDDNLVIFVEPTCDCTKPKYII